MRYTTIATSEHSYYRDAMAQQCTTLFYSSVILSDSEGSKQSEGEASARSGIWVPHTFLHEHLYCLCEKIARALA
jgi:hypothetical protein